MSCSSPWFVVILSVALVGSADAAKTTDRLDPDVYPTRERVELRLDPRSAEYEGSVAIELEVRSARRSFEFHAEALKIHAVVLRGATGAIPVAHEGVADDVVRLTAASELSPGSYELSIEFAAPFGTKAVGLYRVESGGDAYAFTQFEADDARQAFPCWDEPSYKIPFEVVIRAPVGDAVVSNTPVAESREADGWRTTVFAVTPPLPTYLVAIAVGPFDFVDVPGLSVPGRIVTPSGQAHLAKTAVRLMPELLAGLETYFGRPYPFEKLDSIAVPEFWPGAMEHPGAITYRDAILLLDPAAESAVQERRLARVLAHELAHQWFGNLVTLQWWDDLWLNESFADWMGDKITGRVHPEFEVRVTELIGTQRHLAGDARPSAKPIRRPIHSADTLLEGVGLAYAKGKLVLAMFESWIGEETFRQGVIAYLSEHEWGNARSSDLWAALDEASGQPVSDALKPFLEQPGYPLVRVDVMDGHRVRLRQERFHTAGIELAPLTWTLPLSLRYEDDDGVKLHRVLLRDPEMIVALPGDGAVRWIDPNGNGAGYFRWTTGDAGIRAVVDAASALTPAERVELIGNLGALLDAGEVSGDVYLAALSAFAADSQPLVVQSVLEGLETVREALITPELEEPFAAYVRRSLQPAAERLGWLVRAGDTPSERVVRPRVVTAMIDWGRDPQSTIAYQRFGAHYLLDPSSLDPSLVDAALAAYARHGAEREFETLRERFETATVPAERRRFLTALGDFDDPGIQERALRYVLAGPLRTNEILIVPFRIASERHQRERVHDWVVDHFDELSARMTPETISRLPQVASGCDPELMERARAFYSEPAHAGPSTATTLARAADRVAECVGLREREGDAIASYLRSFEGSAGSH